MANYPGEGTGASFPASVALSVQYDAETKRYTLVRPGFSSSFGERELDSQASNAAFTAYRLANATAIDMLRLTKPGTSGAFNYEYVGGGIWRTLDTAGGVEQHRFAAFTYGMPSPDADVPLTGSASFAIGLVANAATSQGMLDIYGTGLLKVDFAERRFTIEGATSNRDLPSPGSTLPGFLRIGRFEGNGLVASGSNAMIGTVNLQATNRYTTSLTGAFFGPGLAEIGATIVGIGSYSAHGLVGSILGRKGDVAPEFETMANLMAPLSLTELSRQVLYREERPGVYSQASLDHQTWSSMSIDPAAGTFRFGLAHLTPATRLANQADPRFTAYQTSGATNHEAKVYRAGAGNPELDLSYTSFAIDNVAVAGDGRRWIDASLFGMQTYGPNVPTSGRGVFEGRVHGGAVGAGASADRFSVEGSAGLDVDFAKSTFTGSMTPFVTNLRTGEISQLGAYTFQNGTLSPMALALNAEIGGPPGASGAMHGSFFGPFAQEVGATFGLITPGAGTVLTATGVIVGKRR